MPTFRWVDEMGIHLFVPVSESIRMIKTKGKEHDVDEISPVQERASICALIACAASTASAQVTFEWVTVGNPGNAADTTGFGSVGSEYRIARYEVTNDQYVEFLNAVATTDTNGLYRTTIASDPRAGIAQSGSTGNFTYTVDANMGNKPVNWASFLDAMRFVNWLHNGQPTGAQDASTTEDGVYAISDGLTEIRSVDAQFFIPTENEWYKAAYHQPSILGGDADDYWRYPTANNIGPTTATGNATGDISNPGTNVANYDTGADWNGLDGNVTTVGSAGSLSESFYGTSDQGGNVWEWNEAVIDTVFRGLRGSSWSNSGNGLPSSFRHSGDPSIGSFEGVGIRIGSPLPIGSVPTVSQWGLAVMSLLMLTAGTVVYDKRVQRPA